MLLTIQDVQAGLPTGTVTFLFSDIEGSTDLSREYGEAYGDLRAEHRRFLRDAVAAHDGSVVDADGDAVFAVFDRAIDAVAAAVAAQHALPETGAVRVRIGIHTTEPRLHSDGYVGVGVSRAARICAAAHGGQIQIVLSHATAGIVEDQDLVALQLRDLGEHRLKDIAHPQRLFQPVAEGLVTEFPPLRTATAGSIGTLLLTDLAGWGRVMRDFGDDAAAAAAGVYHRIVSERIGANNGRVVERGGDRTLSVFPSAEEAVIAAALLRRAWRDSDWITAGTEKPAISAAIHTGRLARPAEGHLGSAALRVGRLCAIAEPGQILVSHATHALLEGRILDQLSLRDLGERELPGAEELARVYEVVDELPPVD